jgi:hypothetical protein
MSQLALTYSPSYARVLRKICEHDMTSTTFVIEEAHGLTPEQERDELRKEMARLVGGKAALSRVDSKGKKR